MNRVRFMASCFMAPEILAHHIRLLLGARGKDADFALRGSYQAVTDAAEGGEVGALGTRFKDRATINIESHRGRRKIRGRNYRGCGWVDEVSWYFVSCTCKPRRGQGWPSSGDAGAFPKSERLRFGWASP